MAPQLISASDAATPRSRDRAGRIVAVLGPTNTGKTHYAVERMLGHESGMIGLPLRLLAREVYDRVVRLKGARLVALITGEEKIVPAFAQYFVCTVEAMPLERRVAFLAVDEIQLCGDPERGHTFTTRLLHARGEAETVFLGSETIKPLINALLPDATVVSRPRFSTLAYSGQKKVTRLPRRSAVVAFSADNVYAIGELIRRQRGGAAVVLGALSPRTRNAQVALYQSGDVDFMIATDAIGMGLNMDIDHVAFAGLRKFDGVHHRDLTATELAQIAGRAGRYLSDGTFGTTGQAGSVGEEIVEQIESHRFDPLTVLQWRNTDLDFARVETLIESLETGPKRRELARARPAADLLTLKSLARREELRGQANGPAAVRLLWDACQIPDFRNVMAEEHAGLCGTIFRHLISDRATIPDDWLQTQVARLDRTEGDLDTLSTRIAHVRTLTFISNRPTWIDDAAHWQERTRAIEDRLSDALHDRLTQRFIDRRTSVLMRRLREDEDLVAAINSEGEVTVEGEFVGRLEGLSFVQDPRVNGQSGALEGKALRAAATQALQPEFASRVERLGSAAAGDISLRRDGTLWWAAGQIARLKKGADALSPKVELVVDELLDATQREVVLARIERWVREHIALVLKPLADLKAAVDETDTAGVEALTGLARGIGFRLVENLGSLPRHVLADDLKALDQTARASLRKFGVRFGEFSVMMPPLLKPAAAELLVLLYAVGDERTVDGNPINPLPPGLTSAPVDEGLANRYYAAAGYRRCGRRVVRLDMLERLAELIREQRQPKPEPAKPAGGGKKTDTAPVAPAAPIPTVRPLEPAAGMSLWEQALGLAPTEAPAPVAADDHDAAPEIEPEAEPVTVAAEAEPEAAPEAEPPVDAPVEAASPSEAAEPEAPDLETPELEAPELEASEIQASSEEPPAAESVETNDTDATRDTGATADTDATAETVAAEASAATEDAPATEPGSEDGAAGEPASETAAEIEVAGEDAAAAEAPAPQTIEPPSGTFRATAAMMSLVGCGGEDFAEILKALGFRPHTVKLSEEVEETFWRRGPQGGRRDNERPRYRRPYEGRGPAEGRGPGDAPGQSEGHGPGEGRGPNEGRGPSEGRPPWRDRRGPGDGRGPGGPGEGRGPRDDRGQRDDRGRGNRDRRGQGPGFWTASPPPPKPAGDAPPASAESHELRNGPGAPAGDTPAQPRPHAAQPRHAPAAKPKKQRVDVSNVDSPFAILKTLKLDTKTDGG